MFFRPSEENERYYYHEDMPVYVQNGNGYSLYTGGAAPSGDAYYRLRYIYTVGSDSVTPEYEPIPASALQSAKRTENGWVVPMGTVFRMQTRAAVSKTSNPTGTLGHSEAIVFHNRYTAKPATNVKIEGVKTLNGDLTLQAGMFTFELYQTDDTFAATGTPVRTTKNLAPVGDSADFAFAMSYDEPGTYYYVVKEQIPTGDDGITYDTTEHHITVTVTDDGKGQLVAAVDKAKSTVAFTNSYDADPVEVAAITGRKTLTGDELKAGDFTFELWQAHKEAGGTGRVFAVGNQPVQKVSNDGNGAFRFEPLTFDTVGDYWYIVRETVGSEPGMDYDTTCHYVEINVKDTLKGQLTADVKINGSATGAITFANIYTKPEDVNALIMLQKEVVGSNAATVGLKDFAFVLSYGNETLLEALSDVNGVAGFQLIFDADDVDKTFEFKVSEQQGLIPGMTYDPMVYTVVIHVGQNADGSLALTINGQSTDTVNLRFTNIYTGVVPPTTGDRFPMMLMSGMILISVAGIAAILLNMRRKHS